MLEILTVWLIVGFTALGFGLLVTRDHDDAFWIGFLMIVAVLLVSHFFIPISPTVGLMLTAVSVLGWLRWRPKPNRKWLIAPLVAVVLAGFATSPSSEPDDGGYHWQVVKWYAEYPVVPGIANLYGRLGFNSSALLYGALFTNLPSSPMHYAQGVLFVASVTSCVIAAGRMRKTFKWSDFFQALMLLPIAMNFEHAWTLETSATAMLIGIVLTVRFVRALDNVNIDQRLLVLFVAGAITIKLNLLVFVIAGLLVVWGVSRFPIRALLVPVTLAGVFGMAWMLHGIVLSGMPLYPSTIGAVDVDWKVTEEQARYETENVTSYARYQLPQLPEGVEEWDWIPAWWNRVSLQPTIYLNLLSLPLLIVVVRRSLRRADRRLLIYIPALLGIMFWFIVMPSSEFGVVSLYTFGIATLTLGASRWQNALVRFLYLIAFLYILLYAPYLWHFNLQDQSSPNYRTYLLADGNPLNVPTDMNYCGAIPLPCSLPINTIVMRTGRLQDGFRPLP